MHEVGRRSPTIFSRSSSPMHRLLLWSVTVYGSRSSAIKTARITTCGSVSTIRCRRSCRAISTDGASGSTTPTKGRLHTAPTRSSRAVSAGQIGRSGAVCGACRPSPSGARAPSRTIPTYSSRCLPRVSNHCVERKLYRLDVVAVVLLLLVVVVADTPSASV